MLFIQFHLEGYWVLCVALFPLLQCALPLLAALSLVRVPPFCTVGPRSRAGSPSWSVPVGITRWCFRSCKPQVPYSFYRVSHNTLP